MPRFAYYLILQAFSFISMSLLDCQELVKKRFTGLVKDRASVEVDSYGVKSLPRCKLEKGMSFE